MGYLIICLTTFFFTSRDNLMVNNMTGVAATTDYRSVILLFTIACSLFFALKLRMIFDYLNWHKKSLFIIIDITAITMSIGALAPYTLNRYDFFSQLHVYCSLLSSLSFLALLFLFTRQLVFRNYDLYQRIHWIYDYGLQMLILFFIVFARVNGYIEILFSILVCFYLYLIEKNIKTLSHAQIDL